MSLPSLKVIAINAGVLLVIGTGAVVLLRDLLFKPGLAGCSARYASSLEMNIKRDGSLMTASDIQASAAGRDMMVMENLTFKPFKAAPAPAGLVVSTKAGSSQADNERGVPGGISYPWLPRGLPKNLEAICLTYSVLLTPDFEFDYAGTLPGVFGASPTLGAANNEKFATHVMWMERGAVMNHASLSAKTGSLTDVSQADGRGGLPRGRWFKVEQEVIMNTPGYADGKIRLWIDGVLRSQSDAVGLRRSEDVFIEGVAVDAYFGGQMHEKRPLEGKARKDETIQLTPFQLRWK